MNNAIKIGIIGGSGFDDPKLLQDYCEEEVKTKYIIAYKNSINNKISVEHSRENCKAYQVKSSKNKN